MKQTETDLLIQQIRDGVQAVYQSESWQSMLAFMSRSSIYRYSLNNIILIYKQRPQAQLVKTYNGWQKNGRQVLRGEKGMRILAPVTKKISEVERARAEKNGERWNPPVDFIDRDVLVRFRAITVFDVEQTNGKPVPTIVKELMSPVENFEVFKEALMAMSPVPVEFRSSDEMEPGVKGYYAALSKIIVVKDDMSELHTLKTLIHEIAHASLHERSNKKRHLEEIEAESVAYMILNHFGLDTSDYSFPYIASWAAGKTPEALMDNLSNIKASANRLIDAMEIQLEISQNLVDQRREHDLEKAVSGSLIQPASAPRYSNDRMKGETER